MPESHRVTCDECGATWTEIYPDGLDGDESHSDPFDPKPCECASQYTFADPRPPITTEVAR